MLKLKIFMLASFHKWGMFKLRGADNINKGCFSKNGSASKLWKALNPKREKLRSWNFTNLFIWGGAVFAETPFMKFRFFSYVLEKKYCRIFKIYLFKRDRSKKEKKMLLWLLLSSEDCEYCEENDTSVVRT